MNFTYKHFVDTVQGNPSFVDYLELSKIVDNNLIFVSSVCECSDIISANHISDFINENDCEIIMSRQVTSSLKLYEYDTPCGNIIKCLINDMDYNDEFYLATENTFNRINSLIMKGFQASNSQQIVPETKNSALLVIKTLKSKYSPNSVIYKSDRLKYKIIVDYKTACRLYQDIRKCRDIAKDMSEPSHKLFDLVCSEPKLGDYGQIHLRNSDKVDDYNSFILEVSM